MKIWIINHYANSPTEPGDARHYSHARELMRRGHQARIIACNFHHLKREYMPLRSGRGWENQVLGEVPFTWITAKPAYRGNSPARILNMVDFSGRLKGLDWATDLAKPDIIMGSSPHPFAALAAQRLAAHFAIPFMLEIRDLWPYVLTEVGGHSKLHPFVILIDRIMRYLYRRASRIVMFSRDSGDLLAQVGADPQKILWIPHGVDLSLSAPPQPALPSGQFVVTYIGAHNQWNSLGTVLDTAKLLLARGHKDVLIRFVGDGASKPGLVRRAKEEAISNVRFEPAVPKDQVPRILHEANAFIINNRKDGVSKGWMSFNKLYEYLAAGRPVIFGSCTENDPVRESGAGVSVEADNPQALATAIEYLAGTPSARLHELGMMGRHFIESQYSIAVLVDRFERAALEVIAQNAGRVDSHQQLERSGALRQQQNS